MSCAGETSGQLDIPAGSYRLRVSARGRDVGAADEFADHIVDHYLLELLVCVTPGGQHPSRGH
jgi:hypothetical protein